MKILKQDFFKKYSQNVFSKLMADEELTINLSGEETLFCRFSKSRIRQIQHIDQGYVSLKFIKGKKSLSLYLKYTGIVDDDIKFTLKKIEEARDHIKNFSEDPYLVKASNYGESSSSSNHPELPEEEMMMTIADLSDHLDLAGVFTSGEMVKATANHLGQFHWFNTQGFHLDYSIYNSKQKAVKAMYAGTHFDKQKLLKNIEDSKFKLSLMSEESRDVKKGKHRVFLSPSAVSELIGTLSWGGVSMSAHKRGLGSLKRLMNQEEVWSEKFHLIEDFSSNLTPRFNELGELSPLKIDIIKKGKLENFLISSRTANEYKLESNFASEWEGLRSPSILGGELLEEDILKKLDTGLYISDLHYLNWSDRQTARITGMTRYACFYVENGQLKSPINDLRFDESYSHIFGEGLVELTKDCQLIPNTGSYFERNLGAVVVPGVIVDNFNFTL